MITIEYCNTACLSIVSLLVYYYMIICIVKCRDKTLVVLRLKLFTRTVYTCIGLRGIARI